MASASCLVALNSRLSDEYRLKNVTITVRRAVPTFACTKPEAVLTLSDSQLAICTTTGAWASRKHKALVARNRKALVQLRAGGADVSFQHIRAPTGHGMNERADELAAQGAQGLRRRDNAIYVPPGRPRLPADTVPD